MGLRDTAEQLDACRQQSLRDEEEIAALRQVVGTLTRGLAETEHELAQAETALADRLRHDSHGTAGLEAELLSARARLARIAAHVDPRRDDLAPISPRLVRMILDDVTAEPGGVFLDPEQAALAGRACRHSAASIRTVLEVDPDRLHPDVAPYAGRLDDLADRLQAAR